MGMPRFACQDILNFVVIIIIVVVVVVVVLPFLDLAHHGVQNLCTFA
jgi:hypothetical protein